MIRIMFDVTLLCDALLVADMLIVMACGRTIRALLEIVGRGSDG